MGLHLTPQIKLDTRGGDLMVSAAEVQAFPPASGGLAKCNAIVFAKNSSPLILSKTLATGETL